MGAYNDDVLFIHIPKCGGTACKEWMYEHLPDVKWPRPASWFAKRDGRNTLRPRDEQRAKQSVEDSKLPIGHIPLMDIETFTGRPIESWERIVVSIRNPYEQQISQWLFWRDRYARGQSHPHDCHAAMHPRFDGWVGTPDADFHIWYEHRLSMTTELRKKTEPQGYDQWGGFYPYWLTVNGKVPPNVRVLDQAQLEHQFPTTMAPFLDGPPPPLHRTNASGITDHLAYLVSWEAVDVVERKFRWAFENGIYPRLERPA